MSYHDYEPVIGLEIHAQLNTKSKMFCTCSTVFGRKDNENTCPVCTGMPGALPVVNQQAVDFSAKIGLALNCEIRSHSVFARKNYFYPDLPKGYQISQYDEPLCENGYVEFLLEDKRQRIGITRAHMEEDAGKSNHKGDHTLINLNRSSVPLLEIVSEPDLRSAAEAAEYARSIRRILRYLEVCDGNLEEGSLRCDCNVSVRRKGETRFGTKVEIKNINSFRFIEKAIDYEILRQVDCLESGEEIIQETRLFDTTKNMTFAMRSKEDAHDYRYFPEPDMLPVVVKEDRIEHLRTSLPELPLEKYDRFCQAYGLSSYDALVLTQEKETALYFEKAAEKCGNPKSVANWIMVELMRELNESKKSISESPICSDHLGELVMLIDKNVISGKIAKQVFEEMWKSGKAPEKVVEEKGLRQITDESQIEQIVNQILQDNPQQVEQYRGGKTKLFGFFVGQAMKATKGQANPAKLNELLKARLEG